VAVHQRIHVGAIILPVVQRIQAVQIVISLLVKSQSAVATTDAEDQFEEMRALSLVHVAESRRKPAEYIYEVSHYEKLQAPLEDFNQLAWFPIEEAISKLKRGSHKWGIEMWKKSHKV